MVAKGTGDLTLTGSADANWIQGNAGANTITGGLGNDRLSGGDGADRFVFAAGDGLDTVTDFELGLDLLDLSATGLGFGDVAIVQSGASAFLYHGDDMIVLTNTTASSLDQDDFIFG